MSDEVKVAMDSTSTHIVLTIEEYNRLHSNLDAANKEIATFREKQMTKEEFTSFLYSGVSTYVGDTWEIKPEWEQKLRACCVKDG